VTISPTLVHQKLMPGWAQVTLAVLLSPGVNVTAGITRRSRSGRLRLEKKGDQQEQREAAGFTVLRFSDHEVLKGMTGVIAFLEEWIKK